MDKKYNIGLLQYFKYDEESPSGLRWIARYKRGSNIKLGDVVGSLDKKDGYWRVHALGCHYKAHKIVWAIHNNFVSQEQLEVDHFDRNRSNNKISNLRIVSGAINSRNREINVNNTTGVSGVAYSERVQPSGVFCSKYTATFYTSSNHKVSKSFSIQKYGCSTALRLAVEWRTEMFEKSDLGYVAHHGTKTK